MSSSYLKYLPANYQTTDKTGFVGRYLKVFEKILTGIDDEQLDGRKGLQELLSEEVIGALFYPRFSFLFENSDDEFIPKISGLLPEEEKVILAKFNQYIGLADIANPSSGYIANLNSSISWENQFEAWLSGFLEWLAGWIALPLVKSWSIDKKRDVVSRILALYRIRGTEFGLNALLNLVFDLPLQIKGQNAQDYYGKQITGQISLEVTIPKTRKIKIKDTTNQAFVLQDQYTTGMPVVGGFAPGYFALIISLPSLNNQNFIMNQDGTNTVMQLADNISALAKKLRPACSHFNLLIKPSLQMTSQGYSAHLGNNCLLGVGAKL